VQAHQLPHAPPPAPDQQQPPQVYQQILSREASQGNSNDILVADATRMLGKEIVVDEVDLNAKSGFHNSSKSVGDVSDSRWEKGFQQDDS
jgi:hypothetical protein